MSTNIDIGQGGGRALPIVTIDPGHGGRQPGAVGATGLQEKDVCLAVSLQTREMLRGRVDVRLTREADVDVPLNRRVAVAGARAFISVHCNAFSDRAANGTETFWRKGRHADSTRLATIAQKHLLTALNRRNRGVKVADFQVLRQAAVPATLLELAFISNIQEEAILRDPQAQTRVARAIADTITEFLGL